jgi:hypothetical protein
MSGVLEVLDGCKSDVGLAARGGRGVVGCWGGDGGWLLRGGGWLLRMGVGLPLSVLLAPTLLQRRMTLPSSQTAADSNVLGP